MKTDIELEAEIFRFWKKPPSKIAISTSKSPSLGISAESAKHPVSGADIINSISKPATP